MSGQYVWDRRRQQDERWVVILDDDPTGTQTVANVDVILRPSPDAYRRFFAGSERAVYVLTNTRALPVQEAVSLLKGMQKEIERAAQEAGKRVAFVLRGDSTLRGHVFAEIDVLAAQLQDWVSLFVPAFPEGGRVTINGVHCITNGTSTIPVAHMEFARDAVFGYQSERIVDWAAEVGQGRHAVSLPLEQLRQQGPPAVTRALLAAPSGSVVIPDAETRADLETIAYGLLDAEEQGRAVVVRSASTFSALRAGLQGAMVQSVKIAADSSVLVVCGSHTGASRRQLDRLVERTLPPVIIPTDWLLKDGLDTVVSWVVRQITLNLDEHRFALLATERLQLPQHGNLAVGAKVMAAVTATVARVANRCDAVIAKGGITSAEVATAGLGATQARVQGQLEAGVSVWDLTLSDGHHIPYAVVPGNMGDDQTLVNVASRFRASMLRTTEASWLPSLFQPVEQKPLVAEITQKLLDYLLSGAIKPGNRLPSERQLSEALGMGRSTLRESLKALTLLGLLEVRQGDGTYLRKADSALLPQVIEWGLLLGEKRTMDLVEVRQRIEVIIAELATERRDSYAVEELRRILKRMEHAGSDYQEFSAADVAFHLKLAETARNTVFRDILSSIQGLLRAWIIRVIESAGNTEFSYQEHRAIFEAVERGDSQAAAAAMQAHMDSARIRLIKAITT